MSKATINMYFAKIAQEYRSEGITCILQCPGYVKVSLCGLCSAYTRLMIARSA